jgi:tetratricopeptide (TPR) repeat protein
MFRLLDADPTGLGSRRLSPFVGREAELEVLRSRLQQVRASGHGHVVVLKGEPGAGKSRLLLELRQHLVAGDVPYLEGRCASHGAGVPYLPLIDLLRRAWCLDAAPDHDAIGPRVRASLTALRVAPDEVVPYLLALLGSREAAAALQPLSPEAVRTRTFDALRRVLRAHADPGPLVVLFEDLHWSDRTSDAFLAAFVDALPGAAVLLVVTARPGYDPPWLARSFGSQLALPPLGEGDGRAIVRSILAGAHGTKRPTDQILARAEGNPFFLEELARAVAVQSPSADAAAVPIPATIAAALTARMDRLPPEPRRVLEAAAVLGREVPQPLLAAVNGTSSDVLAPHLRQLVVGEFLYEHPGPIFVFKHALTQDVAYGRLSPSECDRLHAAAARAIEVLPTGQSGQALERLAYHWARTCNHAKAVHYLARLAERATAAYAIEEALAALDAADVHARRLPDGRERDIAVLDLLVRRGLPLVQLGRFTEARNRFHSARAVAERLAGHPIVGPYYVLLGLALDQLGEQAEASAAAHRAIQEAERCGDSVTAGKACFVLGLEAFWSGQFEDGLRHAQRGSAWLRGGPESWWLGHVIWIGGVNAATLGALDNARAAADETYLVGERSADPRLRSYARWLAGWAAIIAGRPDVGLAACKESYALAPDPLCKAVAAQWLGFAYVESGLAEAAVLHLREALGQYVAFRFPALEGWAWAWLGTALVAQGHLQEAVTAAASALQVSEASRFAYASGLARRALGQAAHSAGDFTTARHELAMASEVLTRIGAAPDAALARIDLAAVCHALGARASAIEHLSIAARTLSDLGAGIGRASIQKLAVALDVPVDVAPGSIAT